MSGNSYTSYNKWKATKIYGKFEVKDYLDSSNNVIDAGVIHGAIDNTSTINSISTSNFDYNGSINASLNGSTGSLPVAIRSLNLKTTGQSYAPDIGYGDTTTFQASNISCNLLYTNNTSPQVGVDIGTQIGNMNTLIYNLQQKLFDLIHSGTLLQQFLTV